MSVIETLTTSLGYYSPKEIENEKSMHGMHSYLWFHNAMNLGSIVTSPTAGFFRTLGAIVKWAMLHFRTPAAFRDTRHKKSVKFLQHQIFRGCLEMLGFGIPLAVGDVVKTLYNHEMLCFKKKTLILPK
jgi:hypothetical protein